MKAEVVNYIENSGPPVAEGTGEETLNCKFVLVAWSACLYCVVGPIAEYRYHANLVERFCDERSIPSAWRQKPDVLEVVNPEARVLGGGHLEINQARRRMKFHGVSRAYGVFNAQDMTGLVKNDTFFTNYRVSFAKF